MRDYLIIAAALWIACSDASGQAYRWVDDQGRVHYTQTPPPPGAKGVQRKNFKGNSAEASDLPYATQVAAKNFPVTLYTMPDCGSLCDQARATLVKRAVPFKEISVSSQKEADEVKRLTGRNDLPLLVVGSQLQSGFQESAYNSLLDTAGYPSTVPSVPIEALRRMDSAAPSGTQQTGAGGQPGDYSR
jgi:glutaredoxin